FFDVNLRDDIGADCKYLSALDKGWTECGNDGSEAPSAFALSFVGEISCWAEHDPAAAVAQKGHHEWRQTEPDDQHARQHHGPRRSRIADSNSAKSVAEAGRRPYFAFSKMSSVRAIIDRRSASGSATIHSLHVWPGCLG